MGGKRLKFPRRKKFSPYEERGELKPEEEPISDEEHQKKVEMLKGLGLLKDDSSSP